MKQNDEFFARLVREHKSTIYTVCYMFSHDEDEVSDLFQETWVQSWTGKIPGEGKGYPLQYSGLENSMD